MIIDRLSLYCKHASLSMRQLSMKRRFGHDLLVPAKNVMQISLINNHEIRPMFKELMSGTCMGGSMDFAKQFLEGEFTIPRLRQIAEQYRTGVKIHALHLQIFHHKTSVNRLNCGIMAQEILDHLYADGTICKMESRVLYRLFVEIVNRDEKGKDSHIESLKSFYNSTENMESCFPNESSLVAQFVKKYPKIDFLEQMIDDVFKAKNLRELFDALNHRGEFTQILFSLLGNSAENIRENWKFDKTIPNLCLRMWNERFALAERRTFQFHSYQLVANRIGMSVLHLYGLSMVSDSENLEKLKDVEVGVYSLSFLTRNGGHVILFFKLDDNYLLWDINIGLLNLGKNYNCTDILKVIKMYSFPFGGKETNHKLCILKLTNNNLLPHETENDKATHLKD